MQSPLKNVGFPKFTVEWVSAVSEPSRGQSVEVTHSMLKWGLKPKANMTDDPLALDLFTDRGRPRSAPHTGRDHTACRSVARRDVFCSIGFGSALGFSTPRFNHPCPWCAMRAGTATPSIALSSIDSNTKASRHLQGFDHTEFTFRSKGRDFRLTDVSGEVVEKLLA